MFCRPFSFFVLPVSPFFLLISYFSHLNGSSCIFMSHCETCPKAPNTFALTAQTSPQTISRGFGISVAMLLCYSAISIHCPSGPDLDQDDQVTDIKTLLDFQRDRSFWP
jgi:hypothetical protein